MVPIVLVSLVAINKGGKARLVGDTKWCLLRYLFSDASWALTRISVGFLRLENVGKHGLLRAVEMLLRLY